VSADFRVTIHDPARRALWQQWIGTDTVCVRMPIRTRVHIEGRGEVDAFVLDEQQLTQAQRLAVCEGLADVFGATAWEVEQDMLGQGIVILAEHCSVMVLNPGKWLL
jgi:hypothetical protein